MLAIVLRDKHRYPLESTYKLEILIGRPPLSHELLTKLASTSPFFSSLKVLSVSISRITDTGQVVLQFNDTESFNPKVIKPDMINLKAFKVYSRKQGDYLNKDDVRFSVTRITETRM